ncbi:serine-threonine protein kinase [Streptomyces noursei ATCC 11455]|uniref:serine/threonine-protein kinase n=1 Tax=Streptomyces noursei TaxID=1971 RepID=UPI00081CE682|nr:serine-threonine protein kinase [Streptomyces noursei ATCC 11455]
MAGYRLLARLGEGGMGSVYLTRTRGNQPAALKVIRREFGQDPDFRSRFEQEVRAARRVQGYHIVPVLDHDTGGELPWLATAFIPGLPLDEALRDGPLPLPAVFQLIGAAADALGSVHAAGVVHRDLKPSNVLLGPQGPYVIDFGIARAADATQLTRSGGFIGTPQYMSPEHASGAQVTPAADVFSLGLIAAVAATGRHPYGDGAAITVAARIANTAQVAPDLDDYPEALRPLLTRCLSADARLRPTPAELAELCRAASGRGPRDFDGWLPDAVAAEIARRERAAKELPEPPPAATPPPPGYAPTQGPAGYTPTRGTGPHAAPTQGATGPVPPPPGGPHATPTVGPGAPAAGKRRSPVLRAAVGAVALVAVVGVTWTVARAGSPGDDVNSRHSSSSGPVTPTPAHQNTTPPAQTPSPDQNAGYQVVFKDRPFALRAPAAADFNSIDLDVPKAMPGVQGDDSPFEISYVSVAGEGLTFRTPMGRSTGRTAQACLDGSHTDVLPKTMKREELDKGRTIHVGTLLCTETTDGNLAMVEITGMTPNTASEMPDFATKVTLWKKG